MMKSERERLSDADGSLSLSLQWFQMGRVMKCGDGMEFHVFVGDFFSEFLPLRIQNEVSVIPMRNHAFEMLHWANE